ncbi:hypothetical protein SO802_028831 [Lithocarpus litseifolius]|uniref:Transmembrane protein n=1 Tax=Lithocarpus litseifolius TaxID=425828 RepID=A0AAW2BTV4_9ROSI
MRPTNPCIRLISAHQLNPTITLGPVYALRETDSPTYIYLSIFVSLFASTSPSQGLKLNLPTSQQHGLRSSMLVLQMVGQEHMPSGRATTPLVHERFTRYKAETIAARNERDEAHAREAEAREQERIAKRKAKKTKLALWIAKDKVYKYRLALLLSWTVLGVYFVFSTIFGGHGHTQLRLP